MFIKKRIRISMICFNLSRILQYAQTLQMFFVIHVVKSILRNLIMLIYFFKTINNMNLCIYPWKPRHLHLSRPRIYSHPLDIYFHSDRFFLFLFYSLCNAHFLSLFLTEYELIFVYKHLYIPSKLS